MHVAHTDHLGTTRLVADDEKRPVWQWLYSAFGNNKPTGPLVQRAPAVNEPPHLRRTDPIHFGLRFPGQHEDAEAGLSNDLFRWYHAGNGRYTQADPIGLPGGANRFLYVGGNPLSYIDSTGLVCEYSQGAGTFVCTDPAGQTYASCTGYSGNGPGLNNPAAQNQQNVGPVPQGTYNGRRDD